MFTPLLKGDAYGGTLVKIILMLTLRLQRNAILDTLMKGMLMLVPWQQGYDDDVSLDAG